MVSIVFLLVYWPVVERQPQRVGWLSSNAIKNTTCDASDIAKFIKIGESLWLRFHAELLFTKLVNEILEARLRERFFLWLLIIVGFTNH